MEYTLTDAAKLAGLNKSTLFRAIKAGKLSARRAEDGVYKVDASELARVYDLQHIGRNDAEAMHNAAMGDAAPAMAAMVGGSVAELALLRARMLEDQLAREREDRERERGRWDQERETILERERTTADDLRKRLDRAEERVLALTAQSMTPATSDPSLLVEELRRRLEESEARDRALVTAVPPDPPPPSAPSEEAPAPVVEELHRRLEELEARNQALVALVVPQTAQERPSPPSAGVTVGPVRSFLGRLLGR